MTVIHTLRAIAFLSLLLALTACEGPRSSAPADGLVYDYDIPHDKTRAQSYDLAEVWIAESYNSGKSVVDLRQFATGTIIAKPTLTVAISHTMSGEPMTGCFPYILKIVNTDHDTTMHIELGADAYGHYPPAEEMHTVRDTFNNLHTSLAARLGPPAPTNAAAKATSTL